MSSVFLISDAARKVQVEAHVLRYWEDELGLPIKRNELGHRYYTEDDIKRFRDIKELKERGLQLKAIKMVLKNGKLDVIGIHTKEELVKTKEESERTKTDETERAKTDETERAKADETERAKADETERAKADETERAKADETERAKGHETERAKANETERAKADETERGKADETERGKADETERAKADAAERTESPQAEPVESFAGGYVEENTLIHPAQQLMQEESRAEKAARLQWLLKQLFRETLQENNRQLCDEVKESLLKELDYQFRAQEEREEEREQKRAKRDEEHFKRIDELLRKKRNLLKKG